MVTVLIVKAATVRELLRSDGRVFVEQAVVDATLGLCSSTQGTRRTAAILPANVMSDQFGNWKLVI